MSYTIEGANGRMFEVPRKVEAEGPNAIQAWLTDQGYEPKPKPPEPAAVPEGEAE